MAEVADFTMPERLTIEEATATTTYSKFIAQPLEKGFGHTLGNALRRILLSSLPGVAAAWVKIDGVPHEFTSMDGVIEDVTDIILNIKRILFLCSGELPRPRPLELHTTRSGDVTAGDITLDSVTTVLNPEQLICHVDKPRELRMEIGIAEGRGYRPADENKTEDQPIGIIPVDCLFSPVRRVAYSIHDCRVGNRTDFDLLEVEVWTDGRITPAEAVKQAARILQTHLGIFVGMDGKAEEDTSGLISTPEDEALLRKLLRNVTEMELSVRAQNCLNNANIRTIGELIAKSESEMMKYRNFGQKSLIELKDKLAQLGLHLGMELKEEVRIAFERELAKLRGGSS